MTAQASDRVLYRDQEFSLVGWEGAGLFDPEQHGLKPFQVSTGNWVGSKNKSVNYSLAANRR